MFFQPNRPRTKAILRTPSWEVKHPSRRLYYVRDCERLHHPSSSRDLTAFLDSVKNTPPTLLKKSRGLLAKHFARLHHHASSGVLLFLQNGPNLFSILPPFLKKTGGVCARHFQQLHHHPSSGCLLLLSLQHRTCRFGAGPPAMRWRTGHCFWILLLGHRTCHFEAGPSAQRHS